jgi:hypothetical protein
MPLPIAARQVLEQELQCQECSAHFAVLGCTFFCPCCGHNSVARTFDEALRRIVSNLEALPIIRQAMDEIGMKDEADAACMSLLESSLGDCVSAFQHFCDAIYSTIPGASAAPRNVFQRLGDGSALWEKATGVAYADLLSTAKLAQLNTYFPRRHVLAHAGGIVDEDYLRRSGDTSYRLGQRIVVSSGDVREAAELVKRLGSGLRSLTAAASKPSSP